MPTFIQNEVTLYQSASRIDKNTRLWDIPTMANVRKLDSKRRLVFPEIFQPGDIFLEESVSPTEVRFSIVKPNEAPLIDVDLDGEWPWIKAPLDKETIARAIREDRDSR